VAPDPIYEHIGALIKARRKTLGQKQETLARTLRISRGALANIETGRQSVLVHQLYKFAAALQLTPSDLLPPPSVDLSRAERTDLPLPTDLKGQQKKQVANFFMQVKTGQKPKTEVIHAKTAKR
jgi:transcriptional regulator with XRE-family HTH domain